MNSTEEAEMLKVLSQYQYGFFISKVICTTSELGVFDLLLESGEPLASTMIAERLGTSLTGMEKLLEACVDLKLLRMERRGNKGYYANTKLANLYLAKSSPKSQYDYMKLLCELFYPSFQYLTDAVREGENQLESIYDPSVKDFFQAVYRSEEKMENYFNALDNVWTLYGREVMSAFDLSHFPLIYDLGGGSGALAKICVSLYPNSTVTIFDLPKVVERAKKHFVPSKEHHITFQEGDFFKDPVPEADLYILTRVAYFWDDEKYVQLLTKLHKTCKPGGGVLIVEVLFNDDKTGHTELEAHFFSISLLLHAQGKIRTPSEHKALLTAAGFEEIQAKKGNVYGAILGRK